MNRSLLFVSIEYPPKPGPGACRNFFFCKDLASDNWEVNVLSVIETSLTHYDKSLDKLTSSATVHRSAVRDTVKTFSIFGKYPKIIEIPDRWILWPFSAVIKGYRLIKKTSPEYIYVSYPSYSNLLVSILLKKLTKVKMVLELRDPFRFRYDGKNVPYHWLYKYIEQLSIKNANAIITTTDECLTLYKNIYPQFTNKPMASFKNGFVSEVHQLAKKNIQKSPSNKFTLLHSGSLYSIGRNPQPLLEALQLLKIDNVINNTNFELIFRGCSPWQKLTDTITSMQLSTMVTFKKPISYVESITELYQCDAIAIIQEEIFNSQIPSKLYDSLFTNKTVIAITPPDSALSKELHQCRQEYGIQCPKELAKNIKNLIENRHSNLKCSVTDIKHLERSIINKNIATFLTESIS